MHVQKTYLGYWYQRTTLHLSEIYDFLKSGKSPLWLDKTKLDGLRDNLQIEDVDLEIGILEKVVARAKGGIEIKVYEDGLVLLSIKHNEIREDVKTLTDYYESLFSPAIGYIFSLGAPVPKELANIKTIFPYFVITKDCTKPDIAKLFSSVSETQYFEITSGDTEIYRGDEYYVINTPAKPSDVEELVGMLVFFREFKSQLHHYLNLHRSIWEKIEQIKERKNIRARKVDDLRVELDNYKKTVELIEGRINQMGIYISTRSAIVEKSKIAEKLHDVLEFRYDNLESSLQYIKSLWSMTKQYLDSTIATLTEINSLSTRNSVDALTVITSVGVIGGILGFLARTDRPVVTDVGLLYIGILLAGSFLINRVLRFGFSFFKYKLTGHKLAKLKVGRKI
ncbi:MAG: hypothetical protein AAB624_02920 [Patescibacteria group bacterium]